MITASVNELIRQKQIHGLPEKVSTKELVALNQGMPIQKIIGFINFDDLPIAVTRKVLIPRYETQEVVIHALKYIKRGMRVLDLGAGSGYMGLTIKQKIGDVDVTLSDIDNEAITQIKTNARNNKLKVNVIQSNLFASITGNFDVIVCNPPYIPNATILANSVINYEPHHALFGGVDGNDFYRKIIDEVIHYLKPSGVIIFEISPDNEHYVASRGFRTIDDINGKKRIAIAHLYDIK